MKIVTLPIVLVLYLGLILIIPHMYDVRCFKEEFNTFFFITASLELYFNFFKRGRFPVLMCCP